MKKFYFIKAWLDGKTFYLTNNPALGIGYANLITRDIIQFDSYFSAHAFLNENKLEQNGIRVYIIDNEELAKEPGVNLTGLAEVYYLENVDGEKCCYDDTTKNYFFQKCDVGFCLWNDKDMLQRSVDTLPAYKDCIIKNIYIKT